ncbi:myosin-6-like [Spea bombifrons]|uniref:myosin-6-like n=1 Tax=Spea bombifrons TaxID=233779 RepID=UPI00234A7B75|nr:myosin-6-like [Spea bombifrons]
MSSVPEPSALHTVLEHVSEIETQLRHENSGICGEVSRHLGAVADAVKELEHVRRATRDLLEMETIETSKLRYKASRLPTIITAEIEAAVSRARSACRSEMLELQSDLQNIATNLEHTARRQTELEELNASLRLHEKTSRDEYQQNVDLLNRQMAEKADKTIAVNETHGRRKDALEAAIELEARMKDLAEDLVSERQQFTEEKRKLMEQIKQTKEKTEEQEKRNIESKKCLSRTKSVFYDTEQKLNRVKEDIVCVKDSVLMLEASHGRLTDKLDTQRNSFVELSGKKNNLELEMANVKADFLKESSSLNERISQLDEEMASAQNAYQTLIETNKQYWEEYQAAKKEEEKEHARKKDTATQLEISRADLNDKMEIYGKLKTELKDMERKSAKLTEISRNNIENLVRQAEELKANLETEKQKRIEIQIKNQDLLKEVELWKLTEETFMSETKQRIESGQKLQDSLLAEDGLLQREIKQWDEQIYILREENVKKNEECSSLEESLSKELEKLQEELGVLDGTLQAEREKLAVKIPVLTEAEEANDKEQQKYEDLKKEAGLLKSIKKSLEVSINKIKKDIETYSSIKESKKSSLKDLRKSSFEKLQKELETITTTEKDIYEVNRKLELVIMENCRLKLRNTQLKEDIDKATEGAKKHKAAEKRMRGELAALVESIEEGWENDAFVSNDFCERDEEILDAIVELIKKLTLREEKIGHLNRNLQAQFMGLASLLESKAGKGKVFSH